MPNAPIEERAEAEWNGNTEIRTEFSDKDAYIAYRKAEEQGRVKRYALKPSNPLNPRRNPMTTLASDVQRPRLGTINEVPVIAGDIIYEGAAVGDNGSGYARPLQAGDYFYGFAEQNADNAAGAAGDVKVRVRTQGAVQVPISVLPSPISARCVCLR